MQEGEFDEQDLDNLKENLKIENLSCDYYHNLITNEQIIQLIEQYLNESLQKQLSKEAIHSLFYTACFWGNRDIVNRLLEKHPNIDINYKVPSTKWTPLHAATFCEHGPIVLKLLQIGSDLLAEDKYGRTPVDFASASDVVWPLYLSFKCKRLDKSQLAEKQILSRRQIQARLQGGYLIDQGIKLAPYQISRKNYRDDDDINHNAAFVNGDVLANDELNYNNDSQSRNFNLWK